jgi:hypothetical protein
MTNKIETMEISIQEIRKLEMKINNNPAPVKIYKMPGRFQTPTKKLFRE